MSLNNTIFFLNGPNLNQLGKRNPEIYGTARLFEIECSVGKNAACEGYRIRSEQSNHEGDLIDWVQEAVEKGYAGILLNAGGLTHTSVSLRDAVEIARDLGVPTVEVHLSNPKEREPFRHESRIEDVCIATFAGKKMQSYEEALGHLIERLGSTVPLDHWYRWKPGEVAQCDNCGGHGNGVAYQGPCVACDGKGWVSLPSAYARLCRKRDCLNPIPPHQMALYCTNKCASADA